MSLVSNYYQRLGLSRMSPGRDKFLSLFQTDINETLLGSVNARFLLFDEILYNLESKRSVALNDLSATQIASAAKQLSTSQYTHIALFLPATEFIATAYDMPGVNQSEIIAALKFQQADLLPSYTEDLQIALNHDDKIATNMALWFSEKRSDELYQAFLENSLSLLLVSPSLFSLMGKESEDEIFIEQTKQYQCYMHCKAEKLLNWDLFFNADIEFPGLLAQWQKKTGQISTADNSSNESKQAKIFSHVAQTNFPKIETLVNLAYCFFPKKARHVNKKRSRLKTGRLGALGGVLLLILLSLPFISNQVRYSREMNKYKHVSQQSLQVQKYKSYILNSEDEWASYQQFPVLNLAQEMKKLDQIIPKDSWLSSLSYRQGKLEIKGSSKNPTGLLQIISEQKDYSNVAFTQNTRVDYGKKNEHFGISFSVEGTDYEQYKEEFFPDINVLN